jgi:hypothetical protein
LHDEAREDAFNFGDTRSSSVFCHATN